jgi:hypothetical protein
MGKSCEDIYEVVDSIVVVGRYAAFALALAGLWPKSLGLNGAFWYVGVAVDP